MVAELFPNDDNPRYDAAKVTPAPPFALARILRLESVAKYLEGSLAAWKGQEPGAYSGGKIVEVTSHLETIKQEIRILQGRATP